MKIKKLLSSILAVALTTSCIGSVMVSNVSAEDVNLYTEDFTDGTFLNNDSGQSYFEVITDETTENKYIKVSSESTGSNTVGASFDAVSSGKIRVKFDYMTNDTANSSYVTLSHYAPSVGENESLSLLGAVKGVYNAFADQSTDKVMATIEPGVWYTQIVTIDMDTLEGNALIYKRGSDTPVGGVRKILTRNEYPYYEWPNVTSTFSHIRFRNAADCYVDNISIDKIEKTDPDVIFEENYESAAYHYKEGSTGTVSVVTEAAGNKYLNVAGGSWGTYKTVYNIPKLTTGKKYEVSFDYMTNAADYSGKQNHVYFADPAYQSYPEYLTVFGMSSGNLRAFGNDYGITVEAGQWYTNKVTFDMDTHEIEAALYKRGETTPLATQSKMLWVNEYNFYEWPKTVAEFGKLNFIGDLDAAVDNIEIKTIYKDPDVVFEEDYDGIAYKTQNSGSGTLITDSETGNKYMSIDMTTDSDWSTNKFAYDIPDMTTGKYQIKFDYMTGESTNQSYVLLTNSGGGAEWLRLLGANNTNLTCMTGDSLGTVVPNQWYTQVVTVDMDSHEVETSFYKKGETTPLASFSKVLTRQSWNWAEWSETLNVFTHLTYYGGRDGCIDSIEIKKLPQDTTVIFEEDYEDLIFKPINSGTGNLITDETTGNTYMEMKAGWSVESEQFMYKIPTISTGKYSIEFDYMKKENLQSYFVLSGDSNAKNWLRLLGCMQWGDGYFTVFNADVENQDTGLGAITMGQWYTQKITVDIDTRTVSAAFYKQGENTPIATSATKILPITDGSYSDWPATSTSFTHLRNFGYGDSYIDNIKITQVYSAPALDLESVAIKTADGEVQEVWTEVASSAKVIDLNFGITMDEATMTDEYIYVTKKDGADKIPATVTYSGGVATITAADNWEPGTYTIHVKNAVANPTGDTLGEDFAVDFTVVAEKASASIWGAFVGEEEIGKYSDLNAGDELILCTAIESGEGEDIKLIAAYYDADGAMVKVEGVDAKLALEMTYTIADCEASSMTFFLWDGYLNIAPLGASFSL